MLSKKMKEDLKKQARYKLIREGLEPDVNEGLSDGLEIEGRAQSEERTDAMMMAAAAAAGLEKHLNKYLRSEGSTSQLGSLAPGAGGKPQVWVKLVTSDGEEREYLIKVSRLKAPY